MLCTVRVGQGSRLCLMLPSIHCSMRQQPATLHFRLLAAACNSSLKQRYKCAFRTLHGWINKDSLWNGCQCQMTMQGLIRICQRQILCTSSNVCRWFSMLNLRHEYNQSESCCVTTVTGTFARTLIVQLRSRQCAVACAEVIGGTVQSPHILQWT